MRAENTPITRIHVASSIRIESIEFRIVT